MTGAAATASSARTWPGSTFLAAGLGATTTIALGTALLAIGHAAETRSSPLEPIGAWRDVLLVGLIAAFLAYALSLATLRMSQVPLVAIVAVSVAIQLAPLASPLLLSRDVYMYWDYGRIAAVHGGNPYRDFPVTWPQDPAYRDASSAWARERSPYGPGWTLLDELGARISGVSPHAATLFFRAIAGIAMLMLVGIVALSTRSAFSTALVGWNPVLALHSAGGGHADAAMMAFAAAGLALAARRPLAAGAAWVGAVAVKVAALAFLGVEVIYRLRERNRRWFAGLAGVGALALTAVTAVFGPTWLRSAGPISNQLRTSDAIGLPARLHELGLPLHAAEVLTAAAFMLLYVWILREAWHGRRRLSLAAGGLCLAVAWLMPWYASWPLVLAAFDRDRAGTLIGIGLSGYVLLDALPI